MQFNIELEPVTMDRRAKPKQNQNRERSDRPNTEVLLEIVF